MPPAPRTHLFCTRLGLSLPFARPTAMSNSLEHWCNNDVKLSRPVSDFERDFANGYLFGEILRKLGFQTDFADFKNSEAPKAMMFN
jgi:hypothetical protein